MSTKIIRIRFLCKNYPLITQQPILDFLIDDFFIRHVLHPTSESEATWEAYFNLHPEKIIPANEARMIILGEEACIIMPDAFYQSCKTGIFDAISNRKKIMS